jgi:hypothetical protein
MSSKVKMSKNPIAEYDPTEDNELGDIWSNFCFTVYLAMDKRFPESFIKVVRLDSERSDEYLYFDRSDGTIGAVQETFRDLYAGIYESHIKVYSVQNRPGLVVYLTDHDHPVNGMEFLLLPCAERTYNKFTGTL